MDIVAKQHRLIRAFGVGVLSGAWGRRDSAFFVLRDDGVQGAERGELAQEVSLGQQLRVIDVGIVACFYVSHALSGEAGCILGLVLLIINLL